MCVRACVWRGMCACVLRTVSCTVRVLVGVDVDVLATWFQVCWIFSQTLTHRDETRRYVVLIGIRLKKGGSPLPLTHCKFMDLSLILVGGVAQWLGRRSLTGKLSLIYA